MLYKTFNKFNTYCAEVNKNFNKKVSKKYLKNDSSLIFSDF